MESPLPNTYHQSCDTLLYSDFLQVLVRKDVTALIVSGEPTHDQLHEAWDKILAEYTDLIKTEKSQSILEAWRKVMQMEYRIALLDQCFYALRLKYDEEVALIIAEQGYDLIQPDEDVSVYSQRINLVEAEAKTLIVLRNQFMNDYRRLCPEDGSEDGLIMDEMQYDKELAALSRFMGYRIVKSQITVREFCSIVNLYLDNNKKTEKDG